MSTSMMDDKQSSSSLLNNVDICAAILADKPPKLPLREELNSLGFEIVLSAAGMGIESAYDQSQISVQQYRTYNTIQDLKHRQANTKRRYFFPKSSAQIQKILQERKRIERELQLPHAVSYETYDIRLRNTSSQEMMMNHRIKHSSSSGGSVSSSNRKKKNDIKHKRRWDMLLLSSSSKNKKDKMKKSMSTKKNKNKKDKTKQDRKHNSSNNNSNNMVDELQNTAPAEAVATTTIPTTTAAATNASLLSSTQQQQTHINHISSQALFPDIAFSSVENSVPHQYNHDNNDSSSASSSSSFPDDLGDTATSNENDDDDEDNENENDFIDDTLYDSSSTMFRSESSKRYKATNINVMGPNHTRSRLLEQQQQQSQSYHHTDSTLSPIGQDMVPDVFGAFDGILADDDLSTSRYTTASSRMVNHNHLHHPNHPNHNLSISIPNNDGTTTSHPYRIRMDPDGSTTTTPLQQQHQDLTNDTSPNKMMNMHEVIALQYSASDGNGNDNYNNDEADTDDRHHPPSPRMELSTMKLLDELQQHQQDQYDHQNPFFQYQHQDEKKDDEYDPTPYGTTTSSTFVQDVLHEADSMSLPAVDNNTSTLHLHDPTMKEEIRTPSTPLVEDVQDSDDDDDEDAKNNHVEQETIENEETIPVMDSTAVAAVHGTVVVTGTDVDLTSNNKNGNNPSSEQPVTQPANEIPNPSQTDDTEVVNKPMNAFERATAEILRVAGIDTTATKPTTPKVSSSKVDTTDINENNTNANLSSPINKTGSSSKKPDGDWIKSAKTVFDTFSTGVLKVAGIDTNHNNAGDSSLAQEQPPSPNKESIKSPTRNADIGAFFDTIISFDVPVSEIDNRVSVDPDLTQVRRNKDGRLPLHALCDRGMPDRTTVPNAKLTDYLLKDVISYQKLIFIVVDSYPPACIMQDKNFDLPVHLVARRLMEWEATWYEIVYQMAAKERNATGVTALAITKLYQTMSMAIEKLLIPLVEIGKSSNLLCQSTGSMGTILPLHIASIFTVSVRCLRLILEAYPDAATVPCDLGILHTFIPDECLPLELHDNLSTDAPKWEIEGATGPTPNEADVHGEDNIRRSDLIFAYNPIEPHRLEKARIRRLETRIQYDALILFGKDDKELDQAHRRLWVWMCTFREQDSGRPTYVNCVKRIISNLPIQSLRYLVSITSDSGEQLIDIATTECLKVLQMRIEELYESEAPIERGTTNEDAMTVYEKELVGQLCRLIFNVPDTSFPTSFIILPYMLSQEEDGSLRLASPESSNVAFQFAECLLNLTDPRSILFILDAKSKEYYGQGIYDTSESSSFYHEEVARIDSFTDTLRSLYESGESYLYLLDESTGLPRIDSTNSIYPIVLASPATLVHKLLPLMMMSMVQMRGEKAIPKIASVILDDKTVVVPPSWVTASDILINYLETPEVFNVEMNEATDALRQFRATCSGRVRINGSPRNGTTEWHTELSILKMLIEINDPEKTYAGLTLAEIPEPVEYEDGLTMTEQLGQIDRHLVNSFDERDPTPNEYESENAAMDSDGTSDLERAPPIYPEHDIIDLSRKMDVLSEMQHRLHNEQTSTAEAPPSVPSFDDNNVLIGNTFSINEEFRNETEADSDEVKPRKNVISRYSLLFDDLEISQKEPSVEPSDDADYQSNETDVQSQEIDTQSTEIRIWNAVDRVWEEVTFQLNSRSELMYEDSQILHLKVALAEQAKKLSDLGKKVSQLKNEERRLISTEAEFYDLTDFTECSETVATSRDSVSGARKLVMRMEDLEERLLCNEIEIQHLSMEAFSVEHDGDKMVERLRTPAPETVSESQKSFAFTSETSAGHSLESGSIATPAQSLSRGNAHRYEKKVVRFNDDLTSVEFLDSPKYGYSPKGLDVSSPIVVLDEFNSSDSYPLIELIESVTAPSTPSTYDSSISDTDVDPSGKIIYINASRDPEGSYMGNVTSPRNRVPQSSGMKSHSSSIGFDQNSSQALSGASETSSNDKLSDMAVTDVSHVPDHPHVEIESAYTSEQSFNSMLYNILNSPTEENTMVNSLSVKSIPTSPGRNDSRYQKLMAVKKKKTDKLLKSAHTDTNNLDSPMSSNFYKNYERVFPNSENEYDEGEMDDSVDTNAAAAAVMESSFRSGSGVGTASITYIDGINTQQPLREISGMSSDKGSYTSDLHSARKVLEIERLISKYTTTSSSNVR